MLKPLSSLKPADILQMEGRFAVFFYTPLCGTCKVARKMLEVVDATLSDLNIYTCDANFAAQLLQEWRVQSVPALAYVDEDGHVELQFAFPDIGQLHLRLKTFFGS